MLATWIFLADAAYQHSNKKSKITLKRRAAPTVVAGTLLKQIQAYVLELKTIRCWPRITNSKGTGVKHSKTFLWHLSMLQETSSQPIWQVAKLNKWSTIKREQTSTCIDQCSNSWPLVLFYIETYFSSTTQIFVEEIRITHLIALTCMHAHGNVNAPPTTQYCTMVLL